ncbi:unnamed protein product [Rangifer tarandus platyrhynchus]|uniref:Uncharacterized protein n=1 Tax=Rangifer tarandus platyrhynchus TaxID=3082113 RepID=A0AC59YQ22_RANTA
MSKRDFGTELRGWHRFAEVPSQPDILMISSSRTLKSMPVSLTWAVNSRATWAFCLESAEPAVFDPRMFRQSRAAALTASQSPLCPAASLQHPSRATGWRGGWESSPRPGLGHAHTACLGASPMP